VAACRDADYNIVPCGQAEAPSAPAAPAVAPQQLLNQGAGAVLQGLNQDARQADAAQEQAVQQQARQLAPQLLNGADRPNLRGHFNPTLVPVKPTDTPQPQPCPFSPTRATILTDVGRALLLSRTTGCVVPFRFLQAKVTHAGQTRDYDGVAALQQGDKVETGPGGWAIVPFDDGTIIVLPSNSTFVLDSVSNTGIISDLLNGRLHDVRKKIERSLGPRVIHGGFTALTVRGTEFDLSVDGVGPDLLALYSGEVVTTIRKAPVSDPRWRAARRLPLEGGAYAELEKGARLETVTRDGRPVAVLSRGRARFVAKAAGLRVATPNTAARAEAGSDFEVSIGSGGLATYGARAGSLDITAEAAGLDSGKIDRWWEQAAPGRP
jgi:hypothetical protein